MTGIGLGMVAADCTRCTHPLGSATPPSTFMRIPTDVFINLCGWLSVRDILALRMSNKCIARASYESGIWFALLRKLHVPLPLLPPTAKYAFGEIIPQTYEWLIVRALYLEQNWRRENPVASHSRFETAERTLKMKMLPGGKYMVEISEHPWSKTYLLTLWDLDHSGKRLPLTGITVYGIPSNIDAQFAVVNGSPSILVAYTTPECMRDTKGVTVIMVPLAVLEEFATHALGSPEYQSFVERLKHEPFQVIHKSSSEYNVSQLSLGELDGEPVLIAVYRPCGVMVHYLCSGARGGMTLGPVPKYHQKGHSIWNVKLLPYQNAILVARVIVPDVVLIDKESRKFVLEIFRIPGPGKTIDHPNSLGQQYIEGLYIDSFNFSELETAWFSALRNPAVRLPAPAHNEPPPISIFLTTKHPRGFVHLLLAPKPIPGTTLVLPDGRTIPRYAYALPAIKLERDHWTDGFARPLLVAGAYRSLVVMRPHVQPLARAAAPRAVQVMWFSTHATWGGPYNSWATPRMTGNAGVTESGAAAVEKVPVSERVRRETSAGMRTSSLRVPEVPAGLAAAMREGTMAFAFDESAGRMCVATEEGPGIHVLDFGSGGWDVAVVR